MFDKLEEVVLQYNHVNQQLQEPDVAKDLGRYRNLMKELADLEVVVLLFKKYKSLVAEIDSQKSLLGSESDEDLREMIKTELPELEEEKKQIEAALKVELIPKDPLDNKNIILEIRAGAGGDESSLFAEQMFRAYSIYSSGQKWQVNTISLSEGNAGGVKEIISSISGDKVYSRLKYESGVHRVQRVPKTESQGRVHTSTVTVAVIPEADAVDVKVHQNDLRIDTYRSSGHGGQSVNTTDSAVRVTHIPTGTVVTCQDGKSQLSNKEQALKVLYSRLLAIEKDKAIKEASDARLAQIGTGDRSERIRTYNFPQSRITDHRIGLTIHSLGEVMEGDFDNVIEPLITFFQAEALQTENSV